jgi:hypothetical protein
MAKPDVVLRRNAHGIAELVVALGLGLTVTWAALFFLTLPHRPHQSDTRDFVIYWATGQQLMHHGNPYDPNAVAWTEKCAGYPAQGSIMRNPPWALPLTVPLGLTSAPMASLPWSMVMLGLLIVSARIVWKIHGEPGNHLQWLGYCFPLALECAMVGQTSILVLLGLVLFLRLHCTRPFWAGASLWFRTLKPHLLLPFGVALIAWIICRRNWRVLSGAATAISVSCLLTVYLDPLAWVQYLHWARSSGIQSEFIPSLSYFLCRIIAPDARWIALVPCALASMWALSYFWKRRRHWDWNEDGNLLILVSILVAPYSWMYDQTLVIPALLAGAFRSKSQGLMAVLCIVYLLIDVQPFWSVRLQWLLNVWPPVFWLAWYLCARTAPPSDREARAVPAVMEAV